MENNFFTKENYYNLKKSIYEKNKREKCGSLMDLYMDSSDKNKKENKKIDKKG